MAGEGWGMARGRREVFVPVQKSALTEAAVCNAVQLQTDGLLHLARPQPDDHGEDFRCYQRGSPISVSLQVKAAFSHDASGGFRFRVDLAQIPKDARAFFVVAVLGTRGLPGFEDECWFIPGAAVRGANRKGSHASVAVYPKRKRGSKWDAFEISQGELGARCLEALRATARAFGTRLPTATAPGLSRIFEGKVGEDAVAHVLIAGSDGRLAVFRPIADTVGQDLVVCDAAGDVQVAAQVKTDFVRGPSSAVGVLVSTRTFRPTPERWIVIVPYVRTQMRPAPLLWAIPSLEFASLAGERDGHLEFNSSPSGAAAPKWKPYRRTHLELSRQFERHLLRLGGRLE